MDDQPIFQALKAVLSYLQDDNDESLTFLTLFYSGYLTNVFYTRGRQKRPPPYLIPKSEVKETPNLADGWMSSKCLGKTILGLMSRTMEENNIIFEMTS